MCVLASFYAEYIESRIFVTVIVGSFGVLIVAVGLWWMGRKKDDEDPEDRS